MAWIGYARASVSDEEFADQEVVLDAAGCTALRRELLDGPTLDPDTELTAVLNFLREDDILVVTSLDRLARSLGDLISIIRRLDKTGAHLLALSQGIDSREYTTAALLNLIQGIAEFEVANRRERQLTGVRRARNAGVYRGRKPQIDQAEIRRRLSEGQGATQIARDMKISRSTIYIVKKQHDRERATPSDA